MLPSARRRAKNKTAQLQNHSGGRGVSLPQVWCTRWEILQLLHHHCLDRQRSTQHTRRNALRLRTSHNRFAVGAATRTWRKKNKWRVLSRLLPRSNRRPRRNNGNRIWPHSKCMVVINLSRNERPIRTKPFTSNPWYQPKYRFLVVVLEFTGRAQYQNSGRDCSSRSL
jgi:hypothetical protein